MGCLRRIGCLALLVILGAVAFLFRGSWMPGDQTSSSSSTASTWQPLTPGGAQRAKTALERLRSPRGPAFLEVAPGDLAAYIFQELSRTLPSSADSVEAGAFGDRLCVRAVIRTSDLGDKNALGPLAMLFGDRERVQLCGLLRIIRPGQAELQVKEFKIREFSVPQALIPRLIRQMSRGERPAELAPDGLPLRTPDYIGDVRVQNGQITMYKTSAIP